MGHKRTSSEERKDKAKRAISPAQETDFTWYFDSEREIFIGRYLGGGKPNRTIASFDFDGTLSVPKSGHGRPKDGNDFRLLDKNLVPRVKEITETRRFVIFTNQRGIGRHTESDDVRDRIHGILKLLGIPCLVIASSFENEYRKPRTGMFDLFIAKFNGGLGVDLNDSVFVGDAAGRMKNSFHKQKDHSDFDYLFALNCGLNFMTPEQFLSGISIEAANEANKKSLPHPPYDPKEWLMRKSPFARNLKTGEEIANKEMFHATWNQTIAAKRVIVVMIGIPASGKSRFVQEFCSDWSIISRDKLGTMEKCEKELLSLVRVKNSEVKVCIDNTNFDVKSRERWLSIARENECSTIAVHMDVSLDQALHNNVFRRLVDLRSGKASASMVPTFVIRKQAKELVPPSLTEGFSEVFIIYFLCEFDGESLRKLYSQYL